MSYIDESYYVNFIGKSELDTGFSELLPRASEIVEEMCLYRVTEDNIESYSQYVQTRFKNAICAQIEYMDVNGGADADNGISVQSATLGKFSYTSAADDGSSDGCSYAPRALRILAPTGLLYRGGGL